MIKGYTAGNSGIQSIRVYKVDGLWGKEIGRIVVTDESGNVDAPASMLEFFEKYPDGAIVDNPGDGEKLGTPEYLDYLRTHVGNKTI